MSVSGRTTTAAWVADPSVPVPVSAERAAAELVGAPARVAAARRLRTDADPAGVLGGLVSLACRLLGVPSGQVSLMTDAEYVAGGVGADASAVGSTRPLAESLGALTAAGRGPLVLPDVGLDPRAVGLPPVRSGMVGSYLGVPLADRQGHVVGSLCVFDAEPRTWSVGDVHTVQVIGRAVATELTSSAVDLEHEAERLRWTLSVDAGEVGSFDLDVVTGRLVGDARMRELFGYADGVFDETVAAVAARLHPADEQRVREATAAAVAGCGGYEAEYRVVLPDGRTRWVQSRGKVLCDEGGRAVRLLGAVYDTTGVHQGQLRTSRMLEAMPSGFVSLDSQWRFTMLNAAAERLLGRERSDLLGQDIWEMFPAAVGSEFETCYRSAVQTQTPQTVEAYYPAPLDGWYDILAWPTPDGLSVYFADVSARKQAVERADRTAARQQLLARVNRELLEAEDVAAVVVGLPRRLVPALAEGCIVTLVEPDGRPRDVGSWHTDPLRRGPLQRYAASRLEVMPSGSPTARVLATGRPMRGDVGKLERMLPDGPVRSLLGQLGAADALVVPIRGRDAVLGALTLFSGAGRIRAADDEATAADVANRIGLALENARLARAHSQLAEGLQRNLLTAPPQPDHAQIVVRYVPASESARVGGDWYDAFLQDGGDTMLVIGDVVGHDVEAAAAMAQLRSLLRGIATSSDRGPAEVLDALDHSMDLLQVATLATAAVVRLEQTAAERDRGVVRMRWANAGHPAPLVVHPDGRLTLLGAERAELLLGVDPTTRRTEQVITLPRGTTVLLYTDGLIERRASDLDAGQDRLHAAVRELAGAGLDELCDGLIARLVDGRPEDDVALVAVRLHAEDRPRPPEAGPDVVAASVGSGS